MSRRAVPSPIAALDAHVDRLAAALPALHAAAPTLASWGERLAERLGAGARLLVASTARQTMCTAVRCASCTVAVSPGRHTASAQSTDSGLGPGPVSAHACAAHRSAASTARSRFSLHPLVEISRTTSPGRACARTWRAKTSVKP